MREGRRGRKIPGRKYSKVWGLQFAVSSIVAFDFLGKGRGDRAASFGRSQCTGLRIPQVWQYAMRVLLICFYGVRYFFFIGTAVGAQAYHIGTSSGRVCLLRRSHGLAT